MSEAGTEQTATVGSMSQENSHDVGNEQPTELPAEAEAEAPSGTMELEAQDNATPDTPSGQGAPAGTCAEPFLVKLAAYHCS